MAYILFKQLYDSSKPSHVWSSHDSSMLLLASDHQHTTPSTLPYRLKEDCSAASPQIPCCHKADYILLSQPVIIRKIPLLPQGIMFKKP